MFYHIVITDNKGMLLADANILADNLIDAGIIAEDICDHYYLVHPDTQLDDFNINCNIEENRDK